MTIVNLLARPSNLLDVYLCGDRFWLLRCTRPKVVVAWFQSSSSVAASWYGSVTQGELNELLADRPILPVEIDRVLLKDCAQRIGEYKTDLQAVRKALRTAFWEKLDTPI